MAVRRAACAAGAEHATGRAAHCHALRNAPLRPLSSTAGTGAGGAGHAARCFAAHSAARVHHDVLAAGQHIFAPRAHQPGAAAAWCCAERRQQRARVVVAHGRVPVQRLLHVRIAAHPEVAVPPIRPHHAVDELDLLLNPGTRHLAGPLQAPAHARAAAAGLPGRAAERCCCYGGGGGAKAAAALHLRAAVLHAAVHCVGTVACRRRLCQCCSCLRCLCSQQRQRGDRLLPGLAKLLRRATAPQVSQYVINTAC